MSRDHARYLHETGWKRVHECGFCARYGYDRYFVSRELEAGYEQVKKYDFRLGVVEVVGSNPAGPIFSKH